MADNNKILQGRANFWFNQITNRMGEFVQVIRNQNNAVLKVYTQDYSKNPNHKMYVEIVSANTVYPVSYFINHLSEPNVARSNKTFFMTADRSGFDQIPGTKKNLNLSEPGNIALLAPIEGTSYKVRQENTYMFLDCAQPDQLFLAVGSGKAKTGLIAGLSVFFEVLDGIEKENWSKVDNAFGKMIDLTQPKNTNSFWKLTFSGFQNKDHSLDATFFFFVKDYETATSGFFVEDEKVYGYKQGGGEKVRIHQQDQFPFITQEYYSDHYNDNFKLDGNLEASLKAGNDFTIKLDELIPDNLEIRKMAGFIIVDKNPSYESPKPELISIEGVMPLPLHPKSLNKTEGATYFLTYFPAMKGSRIELVGSAGAKPNVSEKWEIYPVDAYRGRLGPSIQLNIKVTK